MSQNIIRDIFDAKRDLDGVSSSLMRLAYSFAETGNTHIYGYPENSVGSR